MWFGLGLEVVMSCGSGWEVLPMLTIGPPFYEGLRVVVVAVLIENGSGWI